MSGEDNINQKIETSENGNESRIRKAYYDLLAAGHDWPTNNQIRQAIGGGSFSMIAPITKKIKEERQSKNSSIESIPENTRRVMEQASLTLWQGAHKLAAAAWEEEKQTMLVDLNEYRTEVGFLETQVESVTKKYEDALIDVKKLKQKNTAEIEAITKQSEKMLAEVTSQKDIEIGSLKAVILSKDEYILDFKNEAEALRKELDAVKAEKTKIETLYSLQLKDAPAPKKRSVQRKPKEKTVVEEKESGVK